MIIARPNAFQEVFFEHMCSLSKYAAALEASKKKGGAYDKR